MFKKGEWVTICCFKHNGSVHRVWDKAIVLYDQDGLLVVGNDSALVTEADGRAWQVKEPAITFFFKDKWYNIICMFRSTGLHYYCNIASPYIVSENTIIYVDYDLDLGFKPNQPTKILDEIEYARHREEMGYSNELDYLLKDALYELLKKHKEQVFPFDRKQIYKYYQDFLKCK